jgi:GAF domain-containing protein
VRRHRTAGRKPLKTRRRKTTKPATSTPIPSRRSHTPVADLQEKLRRQARELQESLAREDATSEVLRVISSSPRDPKPVFAAILENATRICEAKFGALFLREGDGFRAVSLHNAPPAFAQAMSSVFDPPPFTAIARAANTKQPVQISDVTATPGYLRGHPFVLTATDLGGFRTILSVPMLREGELIGIISIYRQEVLEFTDKQIELVSHFAKQAVIAIENVRLFEAEQQRARELSESLEQQTATSDVLRVISSSPGDLEPVFQAILENGTRICAAKFGTLWLAEADGLRAHEVYNPTPGFAEIRRGSLIRPNPKTAVGRVLITKKVVQIADLAADAAYIERDPFRVALVEVAGARTLVVVPMLKDDVLVGAISIYRQEAQAFTEKQIALLQSFAAQAVIAIENARLLNEQRESLRQQTATSDVLKVISRSTFDLQTVFDTLVESATRVCEAYDSVIWLRQGDRLNVRAHYGPLSAPAGMASQPIGRGWVTGRAVVDRTPVHVHDLSAAVKEFPAGSEMATRLGHRTTLAIPLMREDEAIGAILIRRTEVMPFTDKQVELVVTFADQAVIAIENARLLNELRQSLEQQTATAEVLRTISSSPGDLAPVFQAMLQNAKRICEAKFGNLALLDGSALRIVALHNAPSALAEARQQEPIVDLKGSIAGVAISTKRLVHFADLAADERYARSVLATAGGARTALVVPLLKEDEIIGTISIYRQEVRPFTDKQIALVQNFAAQAVIAIENARLLNELRQSLQQQTATADVLKVISRSTFDLKAVLNTLVESAARLCEADMASVPRLTGAMFDQVASYGYSPAFHEFLQNNPTSPGRGTVAGRAVVEGRTIHIPDVLADPEYDYIEGQKVGGYRTLLGVPLMREGAAIGVLNIGRSTPRPFTAQQIELAETFADQAVIAIENVRLFDEIQDKSRQLEEASQHKSQFLANMSHELRTPLNAILGYTELMADGAYGEPSEKMLGILKRLEANGKHLLGLINDVLDQDRGRSARPRAVRLLGAGYCPDGSQYAGATGGRQETRL